MNRIKIVLILIILMAALAAPAKAGVAKTKPADITLGNGDYRLVECEMGNAVAYQPRADGRLVIACDAGPLP
ncbi:MAG: hypothetical protein KF770_17510, partial [Anaerolineae bacterium]|nr:hypothetical protein [Anaerolineae bacterium]